MRIRTRLAALTMVGIMRCWSAYGQTATLRAERQLFASVNQARQAQGLSPLRWDESLATAARRHAEAMGANLRVDRCDSYSPTVAFLRVVRLGALAQERGKLDARACDGEDIWQTGATLENAGNLKSDSRRFFLG